MDVSPDGRRLVYTTGGFPDDPPRVIDLVRGIVQGVGYRYSFLHAASREGVCGWVRNRADGSVEAVVQGTPAAVDAVIAWARKGPTGASVDGVDVYEASGDFAGFDIRDTA